MSKHVWSSALLVAGLLLSAAAHAYSRPSDVTVEIVDQYGSTFSQMPVRHSGKAYRAYLQAERGARYRIRVTNRSGERVGLVIAVDGRNIITGARSDLARSESMYVLAPWETNEYSGWRSSLADVHEFYFTEWEDSYAEAFGDRSARGVIAVAVYREKESQALREQKLREQERQRELAKGTESGDATSRDAPSRNAASGDEASGHAPSRDRASGAAPPAAQAPGEADSSFGSRRERKADAEYSEPGTGYGDRRDERAIRVAFEAEPRATSRVFLKYEWRETLCRKRLVACDESGNRFWPDSLSFAPPPPR
jgi:hypothetical protein